VLFEDLILAVVHDGVEVEVELGALAQAGPDQGWSQGSQEAALEIALSAVGVGGQSGRLGDGGEAGAESGGLVRRDVVDVIEATHGDQLQGQRREQVAEGGDHPGARIPSLGHQLGKVELEQLGDGKKESGQAA
jgi:hypothetical protein